MSIKLLIVFLSGRSTTLPRPTVHGPPIVATNLVEIPISWANPIAI
jgi:hypothetical protein